MKRCRNDDIDGKETRRYLWTKVKSRVSNSAKRLPIAKQAAINESAEYVRMTLDRFLHSD